MAAPASATLPPSGRRKDVMNAQTRDATTDATKGRSRLVSPAGLGLVLLLFLLLPFLSVSCEVPGTGTIGADYTGGQLATGAQPEVEIPAGLDDMADEIPPVDPGVQVLTIIVAAVLALGIALPFLPRLGSRVRMFGGAAIAVLAGALMIVVQSVARSNLTTQLTDYAEGLSAETVPGVDRIGDQLIHTGVGFWLSLVVLFAVALLSVGIVFKDKIFPQPARAGVTVTAAPPIWRAQAEPTESPAPTGPAGPSEPPAPAGPGAPTEPPAPVGPGAPSEPAAPAEPAGPSEPPAPTERPGGEHRS
jgi:hypothetical protein